MEEDTKKKSTLATMSLASDQMCGSVFVQEIHC